MHRPVSTALALLGLAPALAAPAAGIVVPAPGGPIAARALQHPALAVEPTLVPPGRLDSAAYNEALADLASLAADPDRALLDARGGTWATLVLSVPLVPGEGAGNALSWEILGAAVPADDAALAEATWRQLHRFLEENRSALRLDPGELVHRVTVHDGGRLIQVHGARHLDGVPVRGSQLNAVINHGNLILLGTDRWGPTALATRPTLPAAGASRVLAAYLGSLVPERFEGEPELVALPVAAGEAYGYRLAWSLQPRFAGDRGSWEALIDAHDGELLELADRNHYGAARRILGGVYPVSNDGQAPDGVEVPGTPMPFADIGGGQFTDAGGNFTAGGTVTTTLAGQFVSINDDCGPISESSAAGDIDLEQGPGTDCVVPPGHSPGDTHAARTVLYEVNRIQEMARGQLPANTWLQGQLQVNTNIPQSCGAFWNGTAISVFRSGGSCANTGEIAAAVDHEWGHGLDDNDAVPTISDPGEGIADVYAALRLDQSCIGRGVFTNGMLCGGYGDPCTPASGCTGVRDIDWAHHDSGQPHDVTWALGNPACNNPFCRGMVYSEAVWDLYTRDLPGLYGFDADHALEITTRLTYLGAGNVSTWFVTTGGCESSTGCGCAASAGYPQFLAADDDNGNLADGTPHMNAIFDAFERHQIHCTTTAPVQDGGCAGRPTTAPAVTASPGSTEVTLSWAPIGGATRYRIFRTDGVFECSFGKTIAGTTAATDFTDGGLQDGREYSYVVAGLTDQDSCLGPTSPCLTVVPGALFSDGFESGETSAWDVVVD